MLVSGRHLSSSVSFSSRKHLEARKTWQHRLLRSVSSNMRPDVASKANKKAVRDNMHMDTRVIEVADLESEVKFNL